MFEQHPVPQQISSYQFRLVGDMTLKQFFQLAAGAVVGLVIYATPLPGIFKWPLIIIFVVMGAAFAFLPLHDRPLEEWMSAFFRAIYGPTLFKWNKETNVSYFAPEQGTLSATATEAPAAVNTNDSVSNLEKMEKAFLNNLTNMFSLHPKTSAIPAVTTAQVPPPQTAVEAEKTTEAQQSVAATTPPELQLHGARVLTATEVITKAASQPIVIEKPAPTMPQAGNVVVATPQAAPITIPQKTGAPIYSAPATAVSGNLTTNTVTQTLPNTEAISGVQAQFSNEAAPPTPASMPNVIVGQVLSASGEIVEAAILEVKDFQGRPVQAFKTNRLGHFTIVTPLPNGTYTIVVEKEGSTFDPITFEAHGSLIPPIAIKAKN